MVARWSNGSDAPVIVVGVDGSPASVSALKWAVQHARTSGSRVRAVTVWHYPISHGIEIDVAHIHLSEDAGRLLANTVAAAGVSNGEIERLVLQGRTTRRLVEQSETAALLVLGVHASQHRLAVPHASVSRHCLQHARCPVALVPHTDTDVPMPDVVRIIAPERAHVR